MELSFVVYRRNPDGKIEFISRHNTQENARTWLTYYRMCDPNNVYFMKEKKYVYHNY